jgi:quercetin dioxygenase-like cupin family protein
MATTREKMSTSVARFEDLKPIDYASFIKDYTPSGTQGYSLIGKAGNTVPPIAGNHGFYMGINKVEAGKGTPLHSHPKPEVFVVLSGQWTFFWGENGENEANLGPWDTISFPARTSEGFRNIGDEEGHLLVVLSGSEVGQVTFTKSNQSNQSNAEAQTASA